MSALTNAFRVAIFDDFFEAFGSLPKAQQKKVREFLRKFRANPTDKSINYEKIHTFVDQNLRTVRIGDDYRAIVLRPESGNVYGLLWVDHHDEAMAWAARKRCTINPEIGAIQIYDLVEAEAVVPTRTAAPIYEAPPLYAGLSDTELLSVGVPAELLPAVRALRTRLELDAAVRQLPSMAYEGLVFLADGEPLADVRDALGLTGAPPAVAPDDFAAALQVDASKNHFVVVDNDEALLAMLDAPLEKWRIFLHPSQRQLVERTWNGPVRVLGGAGTGKTVVAMHRAAWLAREVHTGDHDRILFTTYTANLAEDISQNLDKLLDGAARKRVEVLHIDAWVARFLKANGYDYGITYWPERREADEDWNKALASGSIEFSHAFYREEWERVVQPQGCVSEEDYVKAPRAGRGVRLSRGQRKEIWPVFDAYKNALEAKKLKEAPDAMRDAAALLRSRRAAVPYKSIIVDEAQDIPTVGFVLLRAMIPEGPNDLFIVGDGHQRIYGRQVSLGKAGVRVVGRSRRLRVNYRTTEQIRRFAVAQLEGVHVDDLDDGFDTVKGYLSLMKGPGPSVSNHANFEKEVDAIEAFVRAGVLERTCVLARTNSWVEKCGNALKGRGILIRTITRGTRDDPGAPGLRLATMHRVKGLEFDRVVIACANTKVLPLASALERASDDAAREDAEQQERALFYVALTRARREVLVTSHGTASAWLTGKPSTK